MSTKHQPPTLSLRRPSAERGVSAIRPAETPVAAPPRRSEPPPAPPEPPVPPPPVAEPIVATPTPAAPAPAPVPAPVTPPPPARAASRVSLSREAERLTREPEADFFVSIPQSKKTALKTYCVQNGISMRDWLLEVLAEKGIGTSK